MHDSGGMGRCKRIGNCDSPCQSLTKLQRTFLEVLLERFSIDILHGDARSIVDMENLVDRDDTGVIER